MDSSRFGVFNQLLNANCSLNIMIIVVVRVRVPHLKGEMGLQT